MKNPKTLVALPNDTPITIAAGVIDLLLGLGHGDAKISIGHGEVHIYQELNSEEDAK